MEMTRGVQQARAAQYVELVKVSNFHVGPVSIKTALYVHTISGTSQLESLTIVCQYVDVCLWNHDYWVNWLSTGIDLYLHL